MTPCPITADRDEWRGAVSADESMCGGLYPVHGSVTHSRLVECCDFCGLPADCEPASHRIASQASLRGALAAIIADPNCCAASKAIARAGLVHATRTVDRIRVLEETLQKIADSGNSMNAYLALRALSDGDIDA